MKIKMTKEILLAASKEFMVVMSESLEQSYKKLQKVLGPNTPSEAVYAAQAWTVRELDPSNDLPWQMRLGAALNLRYTQKFGDKLNEQSLEVMLDYSADLILEILDPLLQKSGCGERGNKSDIPPWMR